MPSINDATRALFAAQPVFGDNPVGRAARSALVSRLKGATPGSHTQPWPQPSGPAFRDIFFPGWVADPNLGAVTPATGLDDAWWSGFAVVAVCQTMYNTTSDLRPQLLQPQIDTEVAARNAAMAGTLNALYVALLSSIPASPVSTPLGQIAPGDRPQAAALYTGYLQNPAWISAKVGQAASGQWTDQVWELFHHWLKLRALGMAPAAIDTLIGQLAQAGLPVPASVAGAAWESYLPWLQPATLDWHDLSQATSGILAQVCTAYMGSSMPSCMNEENSFEFTASSQPGSPWRTAAGGSCFVAGTPVLMADGTLRPIEAVAAGEEVRTRSGSARVLTTVALGLERAQVFGIDGRPERFTRTHPFLTMAGAGGAPGPQLACVDPLALMDTVPILASLGLVPLGPGVTLAGYAGGAVVPVPVRSLDVYAADPAATIHDLVVEFDAEGTSEYMVGAAEPRLLVNSELPRFGTSPETAHVLLHMIEAAWPVVDRTMAGVAPERWNDVLYLGLFAASTSLVPDAVRAVQAGSGSVAAAPPAPADLHARAVATAERMVLPGDAGAPGYHAPLGAFVAAVLGVFGDEVNGVVSTGWRRFDSVPLTDATLLGVTALAVDWIAGAAEHPARLTLTLGAGAASVERTVEIPPDPHPGYATPILETVYFDNWRPTGAEVWPLAASLAGTAGASSTLPIPGTIPGGYRLFSLPLTDGQGAPAGQLGVDVRPMTVLEMVAETTARSAWTADAQAAFAGALGQEAGSLLAARFPSAVGPYLAPRA